MLQNAIHSIEGPLALVTESLGAGSSGGTAAGPVIAGNPETAVAALAAACDREFLSDSSLTENSSPYVSGDAGVVLDQPGTPTTSAGSRVAAASNLAAAPYKGGSALLQEIINREGKVQRVLQQLGCCDDVSYRQLYTTELLRKAVSDPVRMAGYLSMPKEERLKYWSQVCLVPLFSVLCVDTGSVCDEDDNGGSCTVCVLHSRGLGLAGSVRDTP